MKNQITLKSRSVGMGFSLNKRTIANLIMADLNQKQDGRMPGPTRKCITEWRCSHKCI